MPARALWNGIIVIRGQRLPVQLFSAVEDQQAHFHLLARRGHARVEQRLVDPTSDDIVEMQDAERAVQLEPGRLVVVDRAELDAIAPPPSRDIRAVRCVARNKIDASWFERPYYLGPTDASAAHYFALVRALEQKQVATIVQWVMRKRSYVGALCGEGGYLMLISLRHANEVIPVTKLKPPEGRPLDPKERTLATHLIEALSGAFDPAEFHDEYQERVQELIAAKRGGKKMRAPRPARVVTKEASLADALQRSLKKVSARQSA